jgi:hypothetical protein
MSASYGYSEDQEPAKKKKKKEYRFDFVLSNCRSASETGQGG